MGGFEFEVARGTDSCDVEEVLLHEEPAVSSPNLGAPYYFPIRGARANRDRLSSGQLELPKERASKYCRSRNRSCDSCCPPFPCEKRPGCSDDYASSHCRFFLIPPPTPIAPLRMERRGACRGATTSIHLSTSTSLVQPLNSRRNTSQHPFATFRHLGLGFTGRT